MFSNTIVMDLQVLVSKKGTKVVTASHLHQVLELPNHHYVINLKKWLSEVYEFKNGIRKPSNMQDYAPRPVKDSPIIEDYYFTIEFAKLVTLLSKSKVKMKYAKWLLSLEDERAEAITKEQVVAVLDLVKAMASVSCQETCERQHLKTYEERNGGKASNWWKHRAEVLGYSAEELRGKVEHIGKTISGKSQRHLLMQVDKYEMIRAGVIDLFMALGKSEHYARSMGDMAKTFAEVLQVEILDDRHTDHLFAPAASSEKVHEIKKIEQALRLSA